MDGLEAATIICIAFISLQNQRPEKGFTAGPIKVPSFA